MIEGLANKGDELQGLKFGALNEAFHEAAGAIPKSWMASNNLKSNGLKVEARGVA